LQIHQYDLSKIKNGKFLHFIPPNELVFSKFNEYLQNILIKILPVSFYSYEELKDKINNSIAESIIDLIKLTDISQNSDPILIQPHIDTLANLLKEKGYNLISKQTTNELLNLESIPKISEQENLIKEEYKKTAPHIKVLSHFLFLMIIVFFSIIPLYSVKNKELSKNKEISNEIKKEYESLYYNTTGEKWENFQKSLNKTTQKIYDTEFSLGIHETFPVKLSSLNILQKIFSQPQVKDLNLIRLYVDILQKKCTIRANTIKRETIQALINSLNSENYEAQLYGTVVTKEDNSYEFEILLKWQ
jgi:hypothetical protein